MQPMDRKIPPVLVLAIGIISVTSSSFIVLEAGEISNEMTARIRLAMFRVFFTAVFAYLILYKVLRLNPKGESLDEVGGKSLNLSMTVAIFLSGCSLALHFALWFISLDYLPVGISLALTNSAPIFVVALTWFLYREQTSLVQILGVVIAVFGASILSFQILDNSTTFVYGFVFAFLSAIALAIYLSLARKGVNELGLWNYFGKVNFVASLFLLCWLLLIRSSPFSVPALIYGFLLALVPGIMGHASFQYAMARVRSAIVSISTLGEPLLGTIVAWLILGQSLTFFQILGGLLILFGVYVTSTR